MVLYIRSILTVLKTIKIGLLSIRWIASCIVCTTAGATSSAIVYRYRRCSYGGVYNSINLLANSTLYCYTLGLLKHMHRVA